MKFLYILIALVLFVSCSDDSIFDVPSGKPEIIDIQSNISFPTDTLVLFGKFIPVVSDDNYLVFNDSIKINSKNCLTWNSQKITFILPDSISSGNVYCIFGKDTSAKFNITILPYPPFSTSTLSSGIYLRGSENGFNDEAPVKSINITSELIVSKTELNQRLFEYIMKSNPSTLKSNNLPVYNTTWLEAIEFCNSLSAKDSLEKAYSIINDEVVWNDNANGWRLPTEAEWEYFARAGELADSPQDLNKYAWFNQNSGMNPHIISSKQPNTFGIYDALGNVSEWCWDYYEANYYNSNDTLNPKGPINGEYRVHRGGSFEDGKSYVRYSSRRSAFNNVGIRIVRNAD